MFYFCAGEMAERSNAAVLKTVDCHRSGGSNPSLSADSKASTIVLAFVVLYESEPKVQASIQNNKSHCHEVAWLLNLNPPKRDHEIIPKRQQ